MEVSLVAGKVSPLSIFNSPSRAFNRLPNRRAGRLAPRNPLRVESGRTQEEERMGSLLLDALLGHDCVHHALSLLPPLPLAPHGDRESGERSDRHVHGDPLLPRLLPRRAPGRTRAAAHEGRAGDCAAGGWIGEECEKLRNGVHLYTNIFFFSLHERTLGPIQEI